MNQSNNLPGQMFHMVNVERAKHRLPPFRWNSRLATVAYYHAIDMMKLKKLTHDSPTTGNVADRLRNYDGGGIPFRACGENCAFGNKSAFSLRKDGRVVYLNKGLFSSPPHRANLLSTDFKEVGIAIIEDVENSQGHSGAIYICQVFKL